MSHVYTIDEDGNEFLYGRSVSFVPGWAVHDHHMDGSDESRLGNGDIGEDKVTPTHHESKNKRIRDTGKCDCQYCIGEGDQYHGARTRGPKQVPFVHGHRLVEYGLWLVRVGSYDCWKDHRHYQARDRVPMPRRVDIVDVLQGLYPLR